MTQSISSKMIKAFTIMEIMVVSIILGVIAALAIPNYQKSVEQSHVTDALNQLTAIHSANEITFAKTNQYWPSTNNHNVTEINTNLALNIIPNGMTYNCNGNGTTYTCTATRNACVVTITEAAISSTNPVGNSSCQ